MPTITNYVGWGVGPWGTPTTWGTEYLSIVPDNVTGVTGTITLRGITTWSTMDEGQTPGFSTIDDSQTSGFSEVSTAQTPGFSTIDDSQTSGVSEVSTAQTADWQNAA